MAGEDKLFNAVSSNRPRRARRGNRCWVNALDEGAEALTRRQHDSKQCNEAKIGDTINEKVDHCEEDGSTEAPTSVLKEDVEGWWGW